MRCQWSKILIWADSNERMMHPPINLDLNAEYLSWLQPRQVDLLVQAQLKQRLSHQALANNRNTGRYGMDFLVHTVFFYRKLIGINFKASDQFAWGILRTFCKVNLNTNV
jgi:hypothetical protein